MTSNGNSPLTVTGLDPGIMYSVTINVFDGTQMIISDQTEVRNITVMGDQSGKAYVRTYYCSYRNKHAFAAYLCNAI